jgi:hypothetical protein
VIERAFYLIDKFVHCKSEAETAFPQCGRHEEKDTTSMKMFLASTALAVALASPAAAQTVNHHTFPSARYAPNAQHEYIYPPDNHPHSSNPANDVYDIRGRYIGSDPDPFIRDYLARGHGNS